MKNKEKISNKLVKITDTERVSSNRIDLLPYTKDVGLELYRIPQETPHFVVMPQNKEEIQKIINLANKQKIPIYPRSSNTNIAGVTIPSEKGIVLDLSKMNKILEIDEQTKTATIEPGVIWGKLRKEARKKNLDIIPIAGPYHGTPVANFLLYNITHYAAKYNMDRAVSLEAVLPNGEIIKTGSRCALNNSEINPYFRYAYGPDITGLFRGSLGCFGIVTELTCRLRPLHEVEKNIDFKFENLEPALNAMREIEKLEITQHVQIKNKEWFLRLDSHPEDLKDESKIERKRDELPEYIYTAGLAGKEKQVDLYEEMLEEEIEKEGGKRIEFDENTQKIHDEVNEGCSKKVIRMYAPYGRYGAVVGYFPLRYSMEAKETVEDITREIGIKDPLTGEPTNIEFAVSPYDRCTSVYIDFEVLYDAQDEEEGEKVEKWIRKCYSELLTEYGLVHSIPNKSLMQLMNSGYRNLLKDIKNSVDPNGILKPGGPWSLEK